MTTRVLDIVREPLQSASDVARQMLALERALPENDGVRSFCVVHRAMSETVDRVAQRSEFQDPELLARLDIHLVTRFFKEVAAGEIDAEHAANAWRPLFQHRFDPDIHPLQFALAGINAHIAFDLACAVAETCREGQTPPGHHSALYHDYCTINDLEDQIHKTVEAKFLTGPLATADRVLGGADDALRHWGFCAAREAAWISAEIMFHLPGPLRDRYRDSLSRKTGFVARLLLIAR
jgi:hypothetical protein